MDRASFDGMTKLSRARRQVLKAAAALSVSPALSSAGSFEAGPLAELDRWLAGHLPEVAASLNPGASEVQLDRLSALIGMPLPQDYRALYRWHNGQQANAQVSTGPWFGLAFPSLDEVEDIWRRWLEFADDPWCDFNELVFSVKPGVVKPLYANRRWVPFAHSGPNCLGIDLDPDVNGTFGQVINFGRDEDLKVALAPSLGTFVHWLVGQLRSGNFSVRAAPGGGHQFSTLHPPARHFFDAIPALFDEPPQPDPS